MATCITSTFPTFSLDIIPHSFLTMLLLYLYLEETFKGFCKYLCFRPGHSLVFQTVTVFRNCFHKGKNYEIDMVDRQFNPLKA